MNPRLAGIFLYTPYMIYVEDRTNYSFQHHYFIIALKKCKISCICIDFALFFIILCLGVLSGVGTMKKHKWTHQTTHLGSAYLYEITKSFNNFNY